jgi:hypothetical protein
VHLRSRNNIDWTAKLSHVARALEHLGVSSGRFDGKWSQC